MARAIRYACTPTPFLMCAAAASKAFRRRTAAVRDLSMGIIKFVEIVCFTYKNLRMEFLVQSSNFGTEEVIFNQYSTPPKEETLLCSLRVPVKSLLLHYELRGYQN